MDAERTETKREKTRRRWKIVFEFMLVDAVAVAARVLCTLSELFRKQCLKLNLQRTKSRFYGGLEFLSLKQHNVRIGRLLLLFFFLLKIQRNSAWGEVLKTGLSLRICNGHGVGHEVSHGASSVPSLQRSDVLACL